MRADFKGFMMVLAASALVVGCSGSEGGEDGGADGGGDGGSVTDGGSNTDAGTADAGGGCTQTGPNACDATQFCDDTDGQCKRRCDQPAAMMPTMCDATTQACDPTTGTCIAKCNDTSCTGGLVCGPDGLCEAACVNATCLATEELCVAAENDCGTPDTATGTTCTLPTMMGDMIPSREAAGPILYNVTATDGATADDALCASAGANTKVVFVSFTWSDPSGDFPTTNGTLFTRFKAFRLQGTMVDTIDGYSNTAMFTAGQTGSAGTVTVPMCFSERPDDLVISVEDSAGNTSNKACVVVPAMM